MRTSIAVCWLPLVLVTACSEGVSRDTGSDDGDNPGASAGASSHGSATAGSPNGESASGGGGLGNTIGAGSSNQPAAGGGANAGVGGSSNDGSSGAKQGGSNDGGSGGANVGGSSNGGAPSGACTRELLKGTIDAYFKALTEHATTGLPLAENVKFTENGKTSRLGSAGLWLTAGAVKYAHSALDTELCMSATEAVVADGATDVPMALRLRLQDQKLSEVETIVARAGDYSAVVASPTALAASDGVVKWADVVPADQRAKREDITGWMKKYFVQFPAGVCNTTSDCKRMENGGGSFVCGQGASCAASSGSGEPVLNPRLVMADVETGLGVGFTIFTGGYVDMHMFKMYGGKVHAVSAILANGSSSGWE